MKVIGVNGEFVKLLVTDNDTYYMGSLENASKFNDDSRRIDDILRRVRNSRPSAVVFTLPDNIFGTKTKNRVEG